MRGAESSQKGVLDTLKDLIRWDTIKSKFYENQSLLLELGLFFGIGFLVGFFIKKFGKLVAIIIAALVVLGILQQLGLISVSVHWSYIHETLGIGPVPVLDETFISHSISWVKGHILPTLLLILGFVLGMRFA